MRGIVENYDAGMEPTRTSPFYLDASEVFNLPGAFSFTTKYPGRYLLIAQGSGGAGYYSNGDGQGAGGGGGGYAERVVDLSKGVQIVGSVGSPSTAVGSTTLSAAGFTLTGVGGDSCTLFTWIGGAGGMGTGGTLNLRGGKGGDSLPGGGPGGVGEGNYGGAGGSAPSYCGGGGGGASNSGYLKGGHGFSTSSGQATYAVGGGRGGAGHFGFLGYNFGTGGGAAVIYLGS